MNPRNLFTELKRRNVIRMAGLYLVGAWLADVQVAEHSADRRLTLRVGLLRGIELSLLALGFIPAVIFSWVFELTPQGLEARGRCGA